MVNGLIEVGVAVSGYLLFKGVEKAFIEPIMQGLTVAGFKRFVVPAWKHIDKQLMLPGEMDAFAALGKEWVIRRIIPQEAKDTLSDVVIDQFANYLINEFSMTKHLEKINHGRRTS